MKLLKMTTILLMFIATACCTTSKTKDKAANDSTSIEVAKEMIAAGYTKGTIIASKEESGCPYVIQSEVNGSDVLYDPINLEASFKKDGMEIWYTYRALRMMNRCEKANPISLEKIEKL